MDIKTERLYCWTCDLPPVIGEFSASIKIITLSELKSVQVTMKIVYYGISLKMLFWNTRVYNFLATLKGTKSVSKDTVELRRGTSETVSCRFINLKSIKVN